MVKCVFQSLFLVLHATVTSAAVHEINDASKKASSHEMEMLDLHVNDSLMEETLLKSVEQLMQQGGSHEQNDNDVVKMKESVTDVVLRLEELLRQANPALRYDDTFDGSDDSFASTLDFFLKNDHTPSLRGGTLTSSSDKELEVLDSSTKLEATTTLSPEEQQNEEKKKRTISKWFDKFRTNISKAWRAALHRLGF